MEGRRFIKIKDVERGNLSEEDLIELFVILHSYCPVEYNKENIDRINLYIRHPRMYISDIDKDCYPEDYDTAWLRFKHTDIKKLNTKLFFWGAVYSGEWKYNISNTKPIYNKDNLKRLYLVIQRRFVKHHKIIDGETAFFSMFKQGEDF